MNQKQFEEAIKATAIELSSMNSEELRAEVEKRENCDFSRIFVETGEAFFATSLNLTNHSENLYGCFWHRKSTLSF